MNSVVFSTNIAHQGIFNNTFTQPKNGWYLPVNNNENNNENNKKKSHKFGMTLALTALAAGFGTLALMKGSLPKQFSKYLEKWKFKLEEKTAKGGKFQNFYRYSLNKVEAFLEKSQSINNITSLKDVLFQKFMFGKDGQRTFTRRIHEGITRFFDRISRKTVNLSYSSTNRRFAKLNEYMAEINEKLLRNNPADVSLASKLENIKQLLSGVNDNLGKGFGLNARNSRLQKMKNASDGLFDYFWNASFSDIKNFKSKNMWQSFIAEEYLQPAKLELKTHTNQLRQLISYDINDSYKAAMEVVENIQKFVKPTDMKSNEVLNLLRKNLSKYRNLAGTDELVQRKELNKEIISNMRKFLDTFKENKYDEKILNSALKSVSEIENILCKNQKGNLQEILTLYKSVLPRNEYLKLKSHINSAVKSLDKSIDTEIVQYFDKSRDLKLGSAPTDVLSILGTVGAIGWFLGKADNKDEKISASLKYGIPAVGAIATSLYCTARLISGGKSLAFGLISGWLMNKIGVVIDDTRKKYSLDVSLQNKTLLKPQSDNV